MTAQTATTTELRPVTVLARAAIALIVLALVADSFVMVSNWRDYLVVHDYLAGSATAADLEAADAVTPFLFWPPMAVYVAAGVVFLVWFWRARINAEALAGPDSQRRGRAWAIAGWFVPVLNLWVPYQMASDIWKAGGPKRSTGRGLITTWWVANLVSMIVNRAHTHAVNMDQVTEQSLRSMANLSTVSSAFYLVAGVSLILIISRITGWQTQHAQGRP